MIFVNPKTFKRSYTHLTMQAGSLHRKWRSILDLSTILNFLSKYVTEYGKSAWNIQLWSYLSMKLADNL